MLRDDKGWGGAFHRGLMTPRINRRSPFDFAQGRLSATLRRKTFPGRVRGTADPSAALGMTKGRATLPWRAVGGQKVFFITLGGPQAHDSFGRW